MGFRRPVRLDVVGKFREFSVLPSFGKRDTRGGRNTVWVSGRRRRSSLDKFMFAFLPYRGAVQRIGECFWVAVVTCPGAPT